MRPVLRVTLWAAAGGILLLVALAYLNPHLMVELANQVWACF